MTNYDFQDRPGLAVSAHGLVKDFADNRAVDGIDLEVHRGEIFGVLGPNGAGKTTMLSMLATLLKIDGGDAEIFGLDVRRNPHEVRQLLGVTGQYASVDENLTGFENLYLFGRLLGLSRAESRARATKLLAQFGLEDAADRQIAKFSGGMRRRLDLAVSLVRRPPLIFLDEPTTGLDPRTRGQMWTHDPRARGRGLHGAADHAVPRRGRPARRPDRRDRPRAQGGRGHARRAQGVGRILHAAAAARRPVVPHGRGGHPLAGAARRAGPHAGGGRDQRGPGRRRPRRRGARSRCGRPTSASPPSASPSRPSTRCSWRSPVTTPARPDARTSSTTRWSWRPSDDHHDDVQADRGTTPSPTCATG